MPFEKIGPDRYRGPSGKTFNKKQVDLYYANGGKFPSSGGGGKGHQKPPARHNGKSKK